MIGGLKSKLSRTLTSHGQVNVDHFTASARVVLLWIDYFERTHEADATGLLGALRGILAEVASCIACGLARPAMHLMRTEIDVMLAWIYYSEHPREWRNVNVSADGFKLKAELLKTFDAIEPAFKRRFSLLKAVKKRGEDDPYRLLSAHIHVQSAAVQPSLACLSDIVQPTVIVQVIKLQQEVSEYIGDVCFSMFAGDWVALPAELTKPLRLRFTTSAQYEEFCRLI
jgi:hypothetical protein